MTAALRMRVFDTHCHLGLTGTEDELNAEHARAQAQGVEMLVVGIDLASSVAARDLAARLPGLHWSAGLHPNDAGRFDGEWQGLAALAQQPGCRAIGETGLDLFRDRCPLPRQIESLQAHLDLAATRQLPVILHCRDAHAPLYALLRERGNVRGIMHCFSGTLDDARTALDLGLHLSFAGPLTYPKNQPLREVANYCPADRVLVETDAPFLPPQPWRGKRNEPAFILETVNALAQARSITPEAAARLTYENASRLLVAR